MIHRHAILFYTEIHKAIYLIITLIFILIEPLTCHFHERSIGKACQMHTSFTILIVKLNLAKFNL